MASISTLVRQQMPSYLVPFFYLSYPTVPPSVLDSFPHSSYYGTGPLDACLIVTIIAVMAILRDAFRLGLFEPFAHSLLSRRLESRRQQKLDSKLNGHHKINGNGNGHAVENPNLQKEVRQIHRSVLRFAEQGWSFVYYTTQWSYGWYVNRNLPTRLFDPTDLWLNYPHIPLAGPLKFFYLTQTAFYLHQILIINAEARRKDHVQMMTHHVITIILMGLSYYMNFTRVGCLVMILMDWCDIFLPLAKMIRYLGISQLACDTTFAIFLVSWLITRHVFFLFVIKSTYYDLPRVQEFIWNPEVGSYLSTSVWLGFTTLLLALQVLQMIWFWMICRVAWRVVIGKGATDERSDDEGDDRDDKDD
ncbi:hypothetical protein AMATHDRAFT_8141 [Amanita thiersii Skay4041]|uniref:TLC domain-containing protein n=1 Tax=Amanita thiersii Skay4041 TaxID=703135 RepID=A0A2A9NEM9_9AGAR|nr:hypothetical protein AMATHDRAFT_8141 [Amanita thiersii Skay4041]